LRPVSIKLEKDRHAGPGRGQKKPLPTSGNGLSKIATLKAAANTGNVYFGGPNITANAADATDGCVIPASGLMVPVGNTSLMIADAAGQTVFWTAL
jgi:hypothetical protein